MRKIKKKFSTHRINPPLKVRKGSEGGYCIVDSDGIIIAEGMTKENAQILVNYHSSFTSSMEWLRAVIEQDVYVVPNERVPSKYHKLRKLLLQRATAFLEYFGWEVATPELPTQEETEVEVVSVEKVLIGRSIANNDEQYY